MRSLVFWVLYEFYCDLFSVIETVTKNCIVVLPSEQKVKIINDVTQNILRFIFIFSIFHYALQHFNNIANHFDNSFEHIRPQ